MNNKILNEISELTNKILKKEFKSVTEIDIPKSGGIYVIKEKNKKFFNGKIFYVGRTKNLAKRIKNYTSDSNSLSNAYLKEKLKRRFGLNAREISDYIKFDCVFITEKIEAFDMYDLIEKLLIAVFRREGEPLVNTEN